MSKDKSPEKREGAWKGLISLRSIFPPISDSAEEGPLYWRERIMISIYLAGIVMGIFALISSASLALRNGLWFLVVAYVLAYICAIAITFLRRIPFAVRAWCGLAIFYILGMLALATGGPGGSGRLWLFSFSLLAVLLLGVKVGIVALVLNAVSLVLLGWLMNGEILRWPVIDLSLGVWTVGSATFIFLNTIVTVSMATLFGRLEEGLKKEQKLVGELAESNDHLRREIEKRERMEIALKQSEKKFRAITDLISDCVYELDEDLNYAYMSPKVENLSGYAAADYIGKSPFDFMAPGEAERLSESIEEILASRQSFRNLENIAICINGQLNVLETSGVPLSDKDEKFSGYICIDRDVTDRKRAEQLLRESEEKYRTLFDKSHDAVYATTPEGKIVDMNPAGVELLGYSSKEELSEVNVARDTYWNPDDREAFQKIIAEDGFIKDYEINLKGKDGRRLTVLLSSHAIYDDEGKVLEYRGIMHDVTERRQLEYQLHQSSKLASVGELATGVAHEINNPVATIDVHAGLIHDILEELSDRLEEHYRELLYSYLGTIEQQVERCQLITNNLLTFARMPEGELKRFEINELLKETTEMVSSTVLADTEVELTLGHELPSCWGSPNLLQQVFVNLLTNAFKATGPKDKITISTSLLDSENIRIEFMDTGHGIAEDIRHRIFDPFFTTSPEGKGTGLGLSISYYIVKQMNGTISVDSAPDHGATFTVTLPIDNRPDGSPAGNRERSSGVSF